MPDPTPRDPWNKREWQEAADLALFWLRGDDLRKYGVLQGGPVVDVVRCEEIIAAPPRRGVRPVEGKVTLHSTGQASDCVPRA